MPRYFVQTAAKAGLGARPVKAIFNELCAQAPAALEQVTGSLPKGFRAEIADTISDGIKARLRRMEEAC
jgi:serine/threonine-protein kinase HipA